MSFKPLTTVLLCYLVVQFADGSGETGTCHSALSAIQEVLDGQTTLPGTSQGRPGKRGALGPRGPIGPRGVEGKRGTCECDLSEVKELARKFAELEHFKTVITRENHAAFPGVCYAGVSTGKIPISDVSASSVYPNSVCYVQKVVLNSPGAWCAAINTAHQWIQVDQRTPKQVTGVLTQGRADYNQFVRTYKISYGDNLARMTFYQEDGHVKTFTGNSEQHATVMNVFSEPITARYFRVHPVAYNGHISMRMELLTC